MMSLRMTAVLLAALLFPACANLGRGPVGLPVTVVLPDRPTNTEMHEHDLHRVTRDAAFLSMNARGCESESKTFALGPVARFEAAARSAR